MTQDGVHDLFSCAPKKDGMRKRIPAPAVSSPYPLFHPWTLQKKEGKHCWGWEEGKRRDTGGMSLGENGKEVKYDQEWDSAPCVYKTGGEEEGVPTANPSSPPPSLSYP